MHEPYAHFEGYEEGYSTELYVRGSEWSLRILYRDKLEHEVKRSSAKDLITQVFMYSGFYGQHGFDVNKIIDAIRVKSIEK